MTERHQSRKNDAFEKALNDLRVAECAMGMARSVEDTRRYKAQADEAAERVKSFVVSETKPLKVWCVLKRYDHEGDDLSAVLATEEEAKAHGELLEKESYADRIIIQEWSIGEKHE